MPNASIAIRIGSHAEKEYFLKMAQYFNGIFVGANLMESTPAGSASLILNLRGGNAGLSYFIDPMTYVFGRYSDMETGEENAELAWLKSEKKVGGKVVFDFKKSYLSMAEHYGPPFITAVNESRALEPKDFPTRTSIREAATRVVSYQVNRIRQEFEKDAELREFLDRVPQPGVVFAPYFYIDPARRADWYNLQKQFVDEVVDVAGDAAAAAMLCIDSADLERTDFIEQIQNDIRDSEVPSVWLWASKLNETICRTELLSCLRNFVETTAAYSKVNLMHSGYFGLALTTIGAETVSHGLGYGEQKNVVPIIGQGLPVVNFYLPALHRRVSPTKLREHFPKVGVRTPADYFGKICDCVVCKGIISKGLAAFEEYCETHIASPDSTRPSQTPAAAKKNRFHFLLNRIKERDQMRRSALQDVVDQLRDAQGAWNTFEYSDHMPKWIEALTGEA